MNFTDLLPLANLLFFAPMYFFLSGIRNDIGAIRKHNLEQEVRLVKLEQYNYNSRQRD